MSAALQESSDDEWSVPGGQGGDLRIRACVATDIKVIALDGLLDGLVYAPLRDTIVKAALDEPRAVVIDVNKLTVREEPAWAVFTTARWQVAEWPDIPIGVVCAHDRGQNALRRNGITRYVPVYATLQSALTELPADGLRKYRRRARASLPAVTGSIRRCRELTDQWLTAWSRPDFAHAVSTVASELVEVALADAATELSLRLETDGSTVAVAVQHVAGTKTRSREAPVDAVSGLELVDANCRVWGSYTSNAGTTVWALVGPENRF